MKNRGPLAFLELVEKNAPFLLMVDALHERIAGGRSLDAFRMLLEIGAPARVAHEIVDRWPMECEPPFRSLRIMAACRVGLFVLRVEEHDWTALLSRCLRLEIMRKEFPEENPKESSCAVPSNSEV